MASNIVLSSAIRQNLLSLQSTAQLMGTTQNRLATGRKVNTALDNPTNFFTSSSLRSRSNDLSALLDSMGIATKTLDATSNGITAITNIIETMQSTLRQARQDRSFKTASYDLDPTATFSELMDDNDASSQIELQPIKASQIVRVSSVCGHHKQVPANSNYAITVERRWEVRRD